MRVRCPKCRRVFEAARPDANGLVACTHCGQRLKVRRPAAKPGQPGKADNLAPVRLVGRSGGKRPTRKPKSPGLLIGLAAGGAAVLGLVVLFIVMAVSGNGTPAPGPGEATAETPEAPEAPTPPSGTPSEPPEPPEPAGPRPVTASESLEPSALFERVTPAVARIDVMDAEFKKRGQGSGFLVSPDGMVVTNYHVMHVGRRALVRFGDNRTYPVTGVLAHDKKKDLAVLKINADRMPYLELLPEAEKPEVGARAFAIGTPAGFTNTLSEGLVSGLREQENRSVVQTTAPISSGSSGGPLLDARGRVIGVNTYVRVERQGNTVIENLNFAVSSEEVHRILRKALAAKAKLADVEGKPLDEKAAADLARAYELISKDKLLNAAGAAESLAKRYPENTQVRLLEGRINMRMNFVDQAIQAFEAAARINPNEAEAHLGMGLAWSKKKEWEKAVKALGQAVNLSPADPVAQRGLGAALLKLGRNDRALAALKEAVQLDEKDAKAWMALGEAYLTQKLYNPAEDAFQHTVKLNPRNARAHARLALAAYRNGHLNAAAGAAAAANQLQPGLPEAYFVMGLLLHRAGEKDKLQKLTEVLGRLDPEMAGKLADELKAAGGQEKESEPAEEADVQKLPDFTKLPEVPEKGEKDSDTPQPPEKPGGEAGEDQGTCHPTGT